MEPKIIGERLEALRGDRTQQAVATAVGVTKNAISAYEDGKRVPRDEIKIKLANFFGTTVTEIFFN
jgi:DNA-binding XRE family transcriptional regulator